ncbi:MAG: NAD-dependent epimerase/dehydratase family protein [Chloroflexi bacterium]|jgi:UDP-glucose 4-epimerase|nr:NAD-dependent epimerase/dehydratase family protein [Chloroflexota bacterium]
MKVLVTGGSGFIGSHLVDALIDRGHQVVIVDNLCTGFINNVNPAAKFYQMSVCDQELAEVFQQEKPELVNHHAAQMIIKRSVENPMFDAQENILGTLNVIHHCIQFGVQKLIYASSGGAIYGEPKYLPVDEEHPINPISEYGVSKHTVEHYLHLYGLRNGLNYVVLRYSNVYGPRQNPGGEAGVVAIFASQMLRGERPTIFGSGDKTRDYTHVFDIVDANLLSMERGQRAIYNLGTGVETSDQAMFDALAKALGYAGSPLYTSARPGEIHRICLDSSKAQKELGWKPRFTLGEGLSQATEYYKSLAGLASRSGA